MEIAGQAAAHRLGSLFIKKVKLNSSSLDVWNDICLPRISGDAALLLIPENYELISPEMASQKLPELIQASLYLQERLAYILIIPDWPHNSPQSLKQESAKLQRGYGDRSSPVSTQESTGLSSRMNSVTVHFPLGLNKLSSIASQIEIVTSSIELCLHQHDSAFSWL